MLNVVKIYKTTWGSISKTGEYLFLTTEYANVVLMIYNIDDGSLHSNVVLASNNGNINTDYKIIRAEMMSLDKVYLCIY